MNKSHTAWFGGYFALQLWKNERRKKSYQKFVFLRIFLEICILVVKYYVVNIISFVRKKQIYLSVCQKAFHEVSVRETTKTKKQTKILNGMQIWRYMRFSCDKCVHMFIYFNSFSLWRILCKVYIENTISMYKC